MATQATWGQRRQWVLAALERYELPLLRFARRLVGDEDAARDVVQHAFLRLCDQPPDSLGDRVGAWLYAVCRNRAVDWLRSQRRSPGLGENDGLQGTSREMDPAVVVEQHDLYCRLNELVAQLPFAQREAIALWSEGCTYREIAAILNTSEGNVRVLVHRGLKAVRQHPVAQRLMEPQERKDRSLPARQPDEVRP